MGKWKVQIIGDDVGLMELSTQLVSPELSIINEDEKYFLISTSFDSLTEAAEVLSKAKELIHLINLGSKFNNDSFPDISDAGIVHSTIEGKSQGYIFITAGLNLTTQVKIISLDNRGSERAMSSSNHLYDLISNVQQSKILKDILSFYNEGSWISLYKAYELICDDLGSFHNLIKSGLANKSTITLFTQTAQSRAALGDSARHTSRKFKPPLDPMSLFEAKNLIKTIIEKMISGK